MSSILTTAVGEDFQISLSENPTTGFLWQAAEIPSGLEMLKRPFSRLSTSTVGGLGTRTFVFRGLSSGEYELKFSLQRGREAAVKHTSVRVIVE